MEQNSKQSKEAKNNKIKNEQTRKNWKKYLQIIGNTLE